MGLTDGVTGDNIQHLILFSHIQLRKDESRRTGPWRGMSVSQGKRREIRGRTSCQCYLPTGSRVSRMNAILLWSCK